MEIKMNKNRLFNIFVVAALSLMVALIIQGGIATDKVALASGASNFAPSAPLCDNPAVERSAIRRVYVEQMDSWLTYTDGSPTGVNGGLIHLLSNARVCSK
jgi:hypothetical protein